ncbi:long-chain-fatty-acid--CoA ligase FadD2 [Gordonia sinesedis]
MNPVFDVAARISLEARALGTMFRAGVVGLESPQKLVGILTALRDYGTVGAAVRIATIRRGGDASAIADDRGEISYAEFDERINRLANAFRDLGLRSGEHTIGVLCRNGRAPLIACFASSRAGLRCVWLNTGFSSTQAREVAEREGVDLLVHDLEFADIVDGLNPSFGSFGVSPDGSDATDFEALIEAGSTDLPPSPAQHGKLILLTSGTTGTPKGAPRTEPRGFVIPAGVLERMPMKPAGSVVIAPPIFHGTGLLIAMVGIALGSKLVLRGGRFDAQRLLEDIDTHRADTICVVPIMLQRILALGTDEIARHDLSSLVAVFTAGSQLHPEVAAQVTAQLGDVIYNLYGSTEVSVATLATPDDVRAAPASVGRPALGVRIKLYDDAGHEVSRGQQGRIFVGTTTPFEGYTGGGGKQIIDGLMSTGDVGHFDAKGRLYIDGRDDDMIVSGGENLFPREVEELLIQHPAVADVAIIGVPDEDYGQRLRAFLVLHEGRSLDSDEVKAHVKAHLANYKVPRDVAFLDALPRNPTGKILKRELATYDV